MTSLEGRLAPPSQTSAKQTTSSPPSPSTLPKKSNISPAPSLMSLCSVMDAPVNIKLRYKDIAKYLIWAECPLNDSAAAMHNKGFVDFVSQSPTNPKTSAQSGFVAKFLPRRKSSIVGGGIGGSLLRSKTATAPTQSKVCVIS